MDLSGGIQTCFPWAEGPRELVALNAPPPVPINGYFSDAPAYETRVRELEAEGLTTSDAQGIADLEFPSFQPKPPSKR